MEENEMDENDEALSASNGDLNYSQTQITSEMRTEIVSQDGVAFQIPPKLDSRQNTQPSELSDAKNSYTNRNNNYASNPTQQSISPASVQKSSQGTHQSNTGVNSLTKQQLRAQKRVSMGLQASGASQGMANQLAAAIDAQKRKTVTGGLPLKSMTDSVNYTGKSSIDNRNVDSSHNSGITFNTANFNHKTINEEKSSSSSAVETNQNTGGYQRNQAKFGKIKSSDPSQSTAGMRSFGLSSPQITGPPSIKSN